MRTKPKKPIIAIIISLLFILLAGVLVFFVPPTAWWIEIITTSLLSVGIGILFIWFTGRKKHGTLLTILLLTLLLLNRFGVLNWITLGSLFMILGLITLIK